MSGHSKWSQIKHQKGISDEKRGQLFSKLAAAITAAARGESNPQFNPRLRAAIDKARSHQLPNANIDRALKQANGTSGPVDELLCEAYGPASVALLIQATTVNRNRTVAEIKKILHDYDAKWAEPGSVRWAFAVLSTGDWQPKFFQEAGPAEVKKIKALVQTLQAHDDIQTVTTNLNLTL